MEGCASWFFFEDFKQDFALTQLPICFEYKKVWLSIAEYDWVLKNTKLIFLLY